MLLAVDDRVEWVAQEVRLRSGQRTAPISSQLAIAATWPNIKVIDEPRLPSGAEMATTVLAATGRPAILIQPALTAVRRNLALACGLGHVVLHEFPILGVDVCLYRDFAAEEQAESFSDALLVPRDLLRRALVRPTCVQRLARLFRVPESVIRRRLLLVR